MSSEGNSHPIGSTQKDFNENPSLHCEPDPGSPIHPTPIQDTGRPGLNGTEGGGEPLVQDPWPPAQETTVAGSGRPSTSLAVGSVEVSKEKPSEQGIKLLGRNE